MNLWTLINTVTFTGWLLWMEKRMATQQEKVDELAAKAQSIEDTLAASVPLIVNGFAFIEAALKAAEANGTPLDFTALETNMDDIKVGVGGLAGLVPADATPPTDGTGDNPTP